MGQPLCLGGAVLLVVAFLVVPAVVDAVVAQGVDRVIKSVERVTLAIVNRRRPRDIPADQLKRLEGGLASLSASVQSLAAAEKELVERSARKRSNL